MIRKGQLIFLVSRTKRYLVPARGKFSCKYGSTDLDRLKGRKFGMKIKIGKETFSVIEPTITDFLFKKAARGPQVILPRDAAVILSETGCGKGWKVVDAGSGSGFLSIFLGYHGCDVTSYEKNKRFFEIARKNVRTIGLKNVKVINADIRKGLKKRNLDLVTLDMESSEKKVRPAYSSLKPGGRIAIYSMHAEQVSAVRKEIKKLEFTSVRTIETLRREWQFESDKKRTWTRPKTHMLGHTGFITFARKI